MHESLKFCTYNIVFIYYWNTKIHEIMKLNVWIPLEIFKWNDSHGLLYICICIYQHLYLNCSLYNYASMVYLESLYNCSSISHSLWINIYFLNQWRGHGWVWVGSNPPTFKKGTHEIFANPETFFFGGVGAGGGGGGRVEREKAWARCVRLC